MPRPAAQDGLTKSQRYRQAQKNRGLKLVRMWVIDTNAPGFKEELARQAAVLRGAPEEQEALDFIEAVTADWINDYPP